MPNTQLTQMFTTLLTLMGSQVGIAVRAELDAIVGASTVDISALQAKIATLQSILDADPSTPEFDQAQNIITTLTGILARIANTESVLTKLEGNATVSGSVDYKIALERARAIAAEQVNAALLADTIDALDAHLDAHALFVNATQSQLATLSNRITTNTAAITAEETRALTAEQALQTAVQALQGIAAGTGTDISTILAEIDLTQASLGLNPDGTYTPTVAAGTDYIADVSTEGVARANTVVNALNRLAVKALEADVALDGRLDIIEGGVTVVGSIAKAVNDAKVSLEDALAAETAARIAADTASEVARTAELASVQLQIANLTGGATGSISSLKEELDRTQAGAGLDFNGAYTADQTTNYIKTATDLKNADKLLDAKIKELSDLKANALDFVSNQGVADLDTTALVKFFYDAMMCGLTRGTNCGQATGASAPVGDGLVI